jgi:hypothetical protein
VSRSHAGSATPVRRHLEEVSRNADSNPDFVRSYELILLVFGAMAGLTWAMLALFVYSVAGDGLPTLVDFTVLLPLTTAFLLSAWLHLPIDVFSLLIGVGAASGLLATSGCILYFRLRGG